MPYEAIWRKGCPVNTIENAHIYLVLATKATVSTTAFEAIVGSRLKPRICRNLACACRAAVTCRASQHVQIVRLLLFSGGGMAGGGWIAGLLYDHLGYYAPAFAVGIGANVLNLLMVSVLVGRQRHRAVQA